MSERSLFIIVGSIAVALAFFYLTGGGAGFMMGPGMMGPWVLGGGGWLGVVVISICLLVGFYLVTAYRSSYSIFDSRALVIAQEGYARGEITFEEYQRIKENLVGMK